MPKELVKDLSNIYILGRGVSLIRCPVEKPENSEYWGCNNVYRAREVDRLFVMHDLYATQFRRDKDLIETVNKKDFPVYTLGKYDVLKNNVQYPMEEVLKEFEQSYFLNNTCYMIALAILQNPKNMTFYGVDLTFGNKSEYFRDAKACVEFWLGVATGRGIMVHLAAESTLLKRVGRSRFYWWKEKVDDVHSYTLQLEPQYLWDNPKCAEKYKIERLDSRV